MADQPVPDLPDASNADVPRVMGVRADNSLALTPTGLPLEGGTLTGDLIVDGVLYGSSGYQEQPSLRVGGLGSKSGMYGSDAGVAFSVNGTYKLNLQPGYVQVNSDLQVEGTINGALAFGIAPNIDTADVLDRAETATMPAVDDDGIATADVEDVLTVNEVLTALLDEVRTLNARINDLETS